MAAHRQATALEIALVQHSLRCEKLENENEYLRDRIEFFMSEREELLNRIPSADLRGSLQQISASLLAALLAWDTGNRNEVAMHLLGALGEVSQLIPTSI